MKSVSHDIGENMAFHDLHKLFTNQSFQLTLLGGPNRRWALCVVLNESESCVTDRFVRPFKYNNEPLTITIQHSYGTAQNIISNILKIYLEDYLEFTSVSVVDTTMNTMNKTLIVNPLDPIQVVESAVLDPNCSSHLFQ